MSLVVDKPMKKREWLDQYADNHEAEILTADGFDDAIMGIVYRKGMDPVALYDRAKCIKILMKQGMTVEEAEEYFSFNVDDAWVGDSTPAWAVLYSKNAGVAE